MSRSKRLAAAKRRGRSGRSVPMDSAYMLGQGPTDRQKRQLAAMHLHEEGRAATREAYGYLAASVLMQCEVDADGNVNIGNDLIEELSARHQLARVAAAVHLSQFGLPLKEAFGLMSLPTENAQGEKGDGQEEEIQDKEEAEDPEFEGAHIIGEDADPPTGPPPEIILE